MLFHTITLVSSSQKGSGRHLSTNPSNFELSKILLSYFLHLQRTHWFHAKWKNNGLVKLAKEQIAQ